VLFLVHAAYPIAPVRPGANWLARVWHLGCRLNGVFPVSSARTVNLARTSSSARSATGQPDGLAKRSET